MTFARRFFSRPGSLFGFAVFVAIVVIALAAPLIFARGPFNIVGMPLLPPGAPGLPAGSDILGRDMAAGLAYGARISLLVGVTST
ncbi:MAG TPA: ABC transporter permease, partial [Rhizomicrobium sp.]|nr:ABC transporter permease [Rhizomicrobium sp.]